MCSFFSIKLITYSLCFFCLASSVNADVYVNGSIYGTFCKGFGIKRCTEERIDATIKSGTMYTLPDKFKKADEKKGDNCFIYVNNVGLSPKFYQYKSGPRHLKSSYKKLGTPDYLRFKCY